MPLHGAQRIPPLHAVGRCVAPLTDSLITSSAFEPAGGRIPRFRVDPSWRWPLPNHWIVGAVGTWDSNCAVTRR